MTDNSAMHPSFSIRGRKVGADHPPLVIPEIGINHGGDVKVAFAMVDAAAAAGAEIVKFQSHIVDDEMSKHARSILPGNADIPIYEIMESCALTVDEESDVKNYAEDKGLIFLSTPFSRAAADHLEALDVAAYKIGSGECNNYPLVKHIAAFGKPVIVSTGMNSIETIRPTVDILEEAGVSYALLHCTNIYPTPPSLVRLQAMQEMQDAFPRAVIGLSDHTLNNATCVGAAAMGASILERHFTDSRERTGPDIVCSMTPDDLTQLIDWSRDVYEARGGQKAPLPEEEATINFAFASVVSVSVISAGEVFSAKNLWVKRPGTGEILARQYHELLGRRASRDIGADEQICWDDVAK